MPGQQIGKQAKDELQLHLLKLPAQPGQETAYMHIPEDPPANGSAAGSVGPGLQLSLRGSYSSTAFKPRHDRSWPPATSSLVGW
jgi:hypothetical protein